MAKQLQLTVPTPCHEDWDSMTPVDKGKFCGSCQKQVIDFSDMSDRQIAEFFKKPSTGSVCGRFMTDQLDRSIDIPKKRIPWVKYFFQFALPAFLLSIKSTSAKAQGIVTIKEINKPTRHIVSKKAPPKCSKPLLGDTIVMEEIVITGKSIETKQKVLNYSSLDSLSNQLSNKLAGKIAGPVITIVNKEPMIAEKRDLSKPSLALTSSLEGRLGGVVVVIGGVSANRNTKKRGKKIIPLLTQIFKDTTTIFFRIFPNPVYSGSQLTIECKQAEEGNYQFQLLNQSGQLVHQKEIRIDAEVRMLNIDLPSVAAGSYFMILTNKKTGKKFSEKIIIQ